MRVHRPEPGVQFIDANGLRFGYLAWGAGEPLFLFHGFPDTARTWDVIGPRLAKAGFRVIAPFLRGYAPSGIPAKDTSEETLGSDVAALIAAFGFARAKVVGHDWGAESVYAAATLAPERLAKMVTVAIPFRSGLAPSPRLAWALRHFVGLRLPGAEARFARHDFAQLEALYRRWSPSWRFTAGDLEPVKNAFAAPGCLHAALGYYRALAFRTPAFMRRPIAVPTLSIVGKEDPAVRPVDFERARPCFTGEYRVTPIPGGHFCHREAPDAFLDAVLPFLRAA